MAKYKIRIEYRTGDSFSTEETQGYVELDWDNLDMAKESLARIKTHYKYVEEYGQYNDKPKDSLPVGVVYDERYHTHMLELLTDDGKPYLYYPFWVGYFERLYEAEIVTEKDSSLYFRL